MAGVHAGNDPGGILCSGNIVYDTLVTPVEELRWGTTTFIDSIESHVGGNGANTSMALATLGTRVRLLGSVGRDAPGEFVIGQMTRAGVDTVAIAVSDQPTATTVGMVNRKGDRALFHRLGASAEAFRIPTEFTPNLCRGISHYHLASLFVLPGLRATGPEMLRRARTAGLTTSLDTNWDPAGTWMPDLEPCLPALEILFMNEDEARMLTGLCNPAAAASAVLGMGVRLAVIKLGGRGCAIFQDEGAEVRCAGFEVDARDTTGAGDCFVAGFLHARSTGCSLAECGRFANAVGALSVQRIGSTAGVLGREQTLEWMRGRSHV